MKYGRQVAILKIQLSPIAPNPLELFTEIWCEDTYGQYTQMYFCFCNLTYFLASWWPS
jgi:hypothetical protein